MSLPKNYQPYLIPLLSALEHGESKTEEEICEHVSIALSLSVQEREQRNTSGNTGIEKRVARAKYHLRDAGHISLSDDGQWSITSDGRHYLQQLNDEGKNQYVKQGRDFEEPAKANEAKSQKKSDKKNRQLRPEQREKDAQTWIWLSVFVAYCFLFGDFWVILQDLDRAGPATAHVLVNVLIVTLPISAGVAWCVWINFSKCYENFRQQTNAKILYLAINPGIIVLAMLVAMLLGRSLGWGSAESLERADVIEESFRLWEMKAASIAFLQFFDACGFHYVWAGFSVGAGIGFYFVKKEDIAD